MPTISFNITAAEANRIQLAVGKVRGLPGPASAEQTRQFIINKLKDFVIEIERENHIASFVPSPISPE